jgi:hypothetical protein
MQDQPSAVDVGTADDRLEREVLALLLRPDRPGPWSVGELGLELGSDLQAGDAVVRLHAAGLVHLCHGFVWATRAAARVCRLVEAT